MAKKTRKTRVRTKKYRKPPKKRQRFSLWWVFVLLVALVVTGGLLFRAFGQRDESLRVACQDFIVGDVSKDLFPYKRGGWKIDKAEADMWLGGYVHDYTSGLDIDALNHLRWIHRGMEVSSVPFLTRAYRVMEVNKDRFYYNFVPTFENYPDSVAIMSVDVDRQMFVINLATDKFAGGRSSLNILIAISHEILGHLSDWLAQLEWLTTEGGMAERAVFEYFNRRMYEDTSENWNAQACDEMHAIAVEMVLLEQMRIMGVQDKTAEPLVAFFFEDIKQDWRSQKWYEYLVRKERIVVN